jgi:thiamine-phosphate pyrophosphorylase
MVLPRLYPITDRELSGGLSHAEIVSLLCRGGATLIQVREKRLDDRLLLLQAGQAVLSARPWGARVVINDRPDVAVLCGAAGVHVGSGDLPPLEARSIVGSGGIVGLSTHSEEEAIAADAASVDYIALGPIYETRHAAVARAPLGPRCVERVARSIGRPLVAIGGIDLSRAGEVLAAGAAAVAVLGDLMASPDMPARVAAYLDLRIVS